MRRQDAQTRIVQRAEVREHEPLVGIRTRIALVRVGERRLEAVVPVGEVDALPAQGVPKS